MDLIMAVAGALSIYLGYKLFCDIAHPKNRIRHLVSGALLAVFGLGILTSEVRNIRTASAWSHTTLRKKRPTEEGSFENPRVNKSRKVAVHLI